MIEEKFVSLISGGIDSPVAAWMIFSKGYTPIFVFFDNYPFTGETTKQRVVNSVEKLKECMLSAQAKLYIIPHGEDLADILRNCPRNLTCILCRRMMYRLAREIAEMENADVLVTGEIIGEHASQTLRNLCVAGTAVEDVGILRPLLCFDKYEVENLGRKIGTFSTSTSSALCCSAPPKEPRTQARMDEVIKAEQRLDLAYMVQRNLAKTESISI